MWLNRASKKQGAFHMNKKIIIVASSLALLSCASSSFALQKTIGGTHFFKDVLTIVFNGFPTQTIFYNAYEDNNGVDISGARFFTSDAPAAVSISSDNGVEWGYPSITMQYPVDDGHRSCQLTFKDGPGILLNFENGVPPTCSGILVSDIHQTGLHDYTLTITDSEP